MLWACLSPGGAKNVSWSWLSPQVTSSNQNYQEKVYFGSSETTFKRQFSNHKKSFNLNEYKNETELSGGQKVRAVTEKLNGK